MFEHATSFLPRMGCGCETMCAATNSSMQGIKMEKDKFSCDSGRPIKDKLVMFRKMLMHAWCDNEKPKCAVFVSQRAEAEACAGEPKEVAKWLKQVRAIPRVDGLNANVLDLMQKLLDVFGSLRLFCRVLCIVCCALPLWDARGAISYYDVDITQDYAEGDLTVYSTRQATKLVGQQGYRSSYEGSGVRLNVKVPNGKVAKVTIVGTSHSVRQGGVSQIVFHIEDERYREGSVYEKSYAANTTIPLYLTFRISGLSGEVVGHYRVDVRYETAAKPKADLTVSGFLASPTSAGVTDAINVQYTIKNCGERSSDSCKAYVYDGSAKIGESTISAISAGCSFDGNFRITAGSLSVGTHTLKVKVDGANQVEEKSESNNESAVQSVTVSAAAPIIQGDTVEVRFHLNGMDALVDKVITKIYRIGQPYSDCHFPSPGGKSGYVFINWVDSSGEAVFETDIASASLRDIYAAWEPLTPVEDEPDLQPYTPSGWSGPLVVSTSSTSTTDSSRFSSGDTIYVSWAAICRDGSAEAFKIALDVDGVRKQTWSCSGLNEGYYTYKDSYSIGKLSAGLHVIKVVIDSEEGVSESNESNNTCSKTITVAADEDDQHETDIIMSLSASEGTKSARLATKAGVSYKFDCTTRPAWVTGLKILDGSNSMSIGYGTTSYGGMNDGLSLSLTVEANTTSSDRSWTLYVYKGTEVFHRVKIVQDAGGSTSLTLSSLVISGAASVASGGQATYTCKANYSDGSSKSVSPDWSISSGANYASIDRSSGVLMANTVSSPQSVKICASYGGILQHKTVTVNPNPSADFVISDGVLIEYKGDGGAVTIPSSVTSIGDSAFAYCDELTSVTIPSNVTSIGYRAFYWCHGLSSVTIPSSVTSIGGAAFYDCDALTSVTIPESVTSIGDYAFCDCAELSLVTIPSSVTSIGYRAFAWCSGLTGINVDPANLYYCSIAGVLYNKDTTELICCPCCATSVTIPSSVTSICDSAFAFCDALTSVAIPSSVTSIGDEAFGFCNGLTSVTIPSGVTSIGEEVFRGCSGLMSVTIPSSVTSIGDRAFADCDGLTSVTIPSSVTNIGYWAFYDCEQLTAVYVDQGDGDRVRGLYDWPSAVEFIELVVRPAAPTGVSATDGAYSDRVSVSWTGSRGATSYDLYRSTTSTRPSSPTWTGVTSPYSDTTAEPGVTYYYWVSADNSAGSTVSSYDTGYRAESSSFTLVDEADTYVDVERGEVAPFATAASVYDGLLYDGEIIVGSVQVKVEKGKTDKSGEFSAKVTATVRLAGQAKAFSFKGGVADATGTVMEMADRNGNWLAVTVGVKGLGGGFIAADRPTVTYRIDGARNVFSGKSAADKAAASDAAQLYQGVYNVVFDGGALSVSVDKKGKAKIAGTVEGNKVSATSQLVVGKDAAVVPVVITKKINVVFCLWVMADGTVEARGIGGANAGRAGNIGAEAVFSLDDMASCWVQARAAGYEFVEDFLPWDVPVTPNGTKWIVADGAKAGQIKMDKDGEVYDKKESDNPSGLKLTFTAKTGIFKGSFKVYAIDTKGKLKSFSATVNGVVVDGIGYGTATIKKVGNVPVMID